MDNRFPSQRQADLRSRTLPSGLDDGLRPSRDPDGAFMVSLETAATLAAKMRQCDEAIVQRQYEEGQRHARELLAAFGLAELRQVTGVEPLRLRHEFRNASPEVRDVVGRALYVCGRALRGSRNPVAPHLGALLFERGSILSPTYLRMTAEFSLLVLGIHDARRLLPGAGADEPRLLKGSALRAVEESLSVRFGIATADVEKASFADKPTPVLFPPGAEAREVIALLAKGAAVAFSAAAHATLHRALQDQELFERKGFGLMRQFFLAHDVSSSWEEAGAELCGMVRSDPTVLSILSGDFSLVFSELGRCYGARARLAHDWRDTKAESAHREKMTLCEEFDSVLRRKSRH